MNFNTFLLERVFKQLDIPDSSLKQVILASDLSSVNGRGFPKELFLLSAPMISRGLLNYAVLQMRRDWIFPFWVHRQLDPGDPAFIPRSQNPLMMNVTHRNWTAVGTPDGFSEAIVDPRGLLTPLPREWSLDTWFFDGTQWHFPSLVGDVRQYWHADSPRLITELHTPVLSLSLEVFVAETRTRSNVLFQRATLRNKSPNMIHGGIAYSIRPFNPEGVAPLDTIEFRSSRHSYVNNAVGVVFAEEPSVVRFGNARVGDSARRLGDERSDHGRMTRCSEGLANASAVFARELPPGESTSVHCSIALADERELTRQHTRLSWKIPFDKRKESHVAQWRGVFGEGGTILGLEDRLQGLFEASRIALLEFSDGPFISPGPYLYHHFWFRDAALMIRALDALGYRERTRKVIDVFPQRLNEKGFFKGPDGEWDSNGAVLWTILKHYELTRSTLWLKGWYKDLVRAGRWITRMRKKTVGEPAGSKGLMPPSLSAEHLGMVDQYYWDSFWSLAGLQAVSRLATELNKSADAEFFNRESDAFASALTDSIEVQRHRLGAPLIPASPRRPFDEGAIGSVCAVYPLQILPALRAPFETVRAIIDRYVDDKGFFHPLIHSGHNVYLTLQLAHACLLQGETDLAWRVADTIIHRSVPPYSFPEAIHPQTGGGAMGDGHHGWAAAEVILFLRDSLLREAGDTLHVFDGGGKLLDRETLIEFRNLSSSFGSISCRLAYESPGKGTITLSSKYLTENRPNGISIFLPFAVGNLKAVNADHLRTSTRRGNETVLELHPDATTIFFERI